MNNMKFENKMFRCAGSFLPLKNVKSLTRHTVEETSGKFWWKKSVETHQLIVSYTTGETYRFSYSSLSSRNEDFVDAAKCLDAAGLIFIPDETEIPTPEHQKEENIPQAQGDNVGI